MKLASEKVSIVPAGIELGQHKTFCQSINYKSVVTTLNSDLFVSAVLVFSLTDDKCRSSLTSEDLDASRQHCISTSKNNTSRDCCGIGSGLVS